MARPLARLLLDTPHGRIGLMVSHDLEFPEWARAADRRSALYG